MKTDVKDAMKWVIITPHVPTDHPLTLIMIQIQILKMNLQVKKKKRIVMIFETKIKKER